MINRTTTIIAIAMGIAIHALVEECIRIASTLLGTLIDDGYPVALCCNGRYSYTDDIILIGHGCSPEHKGTCLTALARLNAEKDTMPTLDFIDAVPKTVGDSELVIVISPETGERLCSQVNDAAGKRELFWIAPVRNDDTAYLPGLSKIKNNCIWGLFVKGSRTPVIVDVLYSLEWFLLAASACLPFACQRLGGAASFCLRRCSL